MFSLYLWVVFLFLFRPTAGTTASPQSAAALVRPPTNGKSTAGKSAAPKASATTAKPASAKPTSATPSGGKPPTSQTSRTTTPLKKGKKNKSITT